MTVHHKGSFQSEPFRKQKSVAGRSLPAHPVRHPNARILVVEDNPTNQMVARGILKQYGYRPETVDNGLEALKALEKSDFDLVFMDVQMPEMDGCEATRAIRDPNSSVRNHDIPIIAMTAQAMASDRERCLASGMDDYISKPFDPKVVMEKIEKMFGEADPAAHGETATASHENPEQGEYEKKEILSELLREDEAFAREIIQTFLAETQKDLACLMEAVESLDRAEVERKGHSIKGAAANVGADALRAVASRIEMAGRNGNLEGIHRTLQEIEEQFEIFQKSVVSPGNV